MKKLISLTFMLLMGLFCLAQEVEFCGSLNTSSVINYQNAYGIGLQYQHDISQKFKVGFGIHYNFKNSNFIKEFEDIDGSAPHWIENTNSKSRRFSIRLNIQRLVRDNENLSISLGPDISYNYLWGKDNISSWSGGSNRKNYMRNMDLVKLFGIGLISKIEIKDFIKPRLSLCLTARPEIVNNLIFKRSENSREAAFVEFQIGIKYRFKK